MLAKQKITLAVLLALTIILSFFAWQALKQFLYDGSDVVNILLLPILFLLLASIFAIIVLLNDSWKILLIAAGIIFFVYILVFGWHWANLAVFTASFGLALIGIAESKKEKIVHLKILPAQTTKPAVRSLFTVLAIAVAMVIYFSPPAQDLKTEVKIPRPLFDVIMNTMSDFIDTQVKSLVTNPANLAIPGMSSISQKAMQELLGSSPLNANEILKPEDRDKLYLLMNQQINFFFQPYKRFLPYGLAVVVFFSLEAIGFLFVFLAGLFTKALFYLLREFNVVKVGREMVEREIIEL